MSTEERMTALEQDLATTQRDFLEHLSTINRSMAILNRVISAQELNGRDIDHNVTILLGVTASQGQDIKTIKNDLSALKEHIDGRFDGIEQRFTSMEGKFEQVLQQLATLTARPEQEK